MAMRTAPGLEHDYRLLRDRAGVVERPVAVVEVRGPDAVDFLQGQVTNDVAALAPGAGCYALLLDPKGRIVAELRALMLERELIWVLTEQVEPVLSNLTMYKIGRDVNVTRRSSTVVSVIGPQARAAVPVELPAAEHSVARAELDETSVVFVATDVGVDVVHDGDGPALAARLGLDPASLDAAELVRIESGRPRHGLDMSDDNLPGELGLEERAVSFTKGCYVGQEPVARMHYKGHPNRHLRGLRLSQPARPGQSLLREGKVVGAVTSPAVSPALGPIALALVRREVAPGEHVEVEGGGDAEVVELPFANDE